jgi:hypothetical protein
VFEIIPIKFPGEFFENIEKLTLKFIWKWKITKIYKMILKKKLKVRAVTLFEELL